MNRGLAARIWFSFIWRFFAGFFIGQIVLGLCFYALTPDRTNPPQFLMRAIYLGELVLVALISFFALRAALFTHLKSGDTVA